MHEETTYRCVNPACARAMPRPVAFCPYCGTAQAAGAPTPVPDPDAQAQRVAAAAAGASAAASLAGWADAPQGENVPPPAPKPPPPPDTTFGHTGRTAPPAPQPPPPPHPQPPPRTRPYHIWGRGPSRPPEPPGPRGRQPVQLRWWILFLLILWGVWLWAKPSARKVERRIDHAVALAHACKAREAQDALIALRKDRATAEQLERLQASLNDEAAACTRKRQRDKAWDETSDAVDIALAAPTTAALDRAHSRLQAFTKRWGEDERTRALRDRIDAARHPLADPGAR